MQRNELGYMIRNARRLKGWTVNKFIEKLTELGQRVSTSYVARIEVHGEIPSMELLKRICVSLELNEGEIVSMAKEQKLQRLHDSIDRRYM